MSRYHSGKNYTKEENEFRSILESSKKLMNENGEVSLEQYLREEFAPCDAAGLLKQESNGAEINWDFRQGEHICVIPCESEIPKVLQKFEDYIDDELEEEYWEMIMSATPTNKRIRDELDIIANQAIRLNNRQKELRGKLARVGKMIEEQLEKNMTEVVAKRAKK